MNGLESTGPTTPTPRVWAQILARYREPSAIRGAFEIAITAIPFVGLWALMWWSLDVSYWLCLAIAAPAAGLLMRFFTIQHDCGHGSFFRSRRANDWVGRIIGVITLTPYGNWRHSHAVHHATSGNLQRRGSGDIDLLTVREYMGRSRWGRLGYRLYRHPFVMFVIGPAFYFVLQQRLPFGQMQEGWQPWFSAMGTNAAMAVLVAMMMWLVGVGPFLLVQIPIVLGAASIGGWMFYIQHQFQDTSWDGDDNWTFHDAALRGSSYYDLPGVLRWFSANIGVHHVHHLCSRIPFYRLPEVLEDHPPLTRMGRLTLWSSLRCAQLSLWDESQRRLVSFREMYSRNGILTPELRLVYGIGDIWSRLQNLVVARN